MTLTGWKHNLKNIVEYISDDGPPNALKLFKRIKNKASSLYNFPDLYLDPMMRAAALGRLERLNEAKAAVSQLCKLAPDFIAQGRWLIGRYVKVDDLVDGIIVGLRKAGMTDFE